MGLQEFFYFVGAKVLGRREPKGTPRWSLPEFVRNGVREENRRQHEKRRRREAMKEALRS